MDDLTQELDEWLLAAWANSDDDQAAGQALQCALSHPPGSAKLTARTLQLAARMWLAEDFSQRVDEQLRPHRQRLVTRLRQIDRIGDPNNEPQVLFAELADEETDAIDFAGFDLDRLRNLRHGAGSRAQAASNFMHEIGIGRWPATLLTELQTALDDLKAQIASGQLSQALLVGPGDLGFVIGVRLALQSEEKVTTVERIDTALQVSAETAISEVLASGGARYGMEWHLPFEGTSIGLPMALAVLVATRKLEPDPLTAVTGEVITGGAVIGVGGVEAKLRAAEASGIQRVILPEDNRPAAEGLGLDLDLRFVSHVDQLRTAASVASTSEEIGVVAKKRIVRALLEPTAGFRVTEERAINHGYQFKVESAATKGTLSLYDSGSIVVGAAAAPKQQLESFATQYLREPEPETRETLTLRLPGDDLRGRARKALATIGADLQPPREHEIWRLRLARGKSAATAVLYSSGKLVLQGTAPAHDEARATLAPLLATLQGADALTARPAADRVRERRAQSVGEPWIGTDESGKGDYFGPLVTAAVYVDQALARQLDDLGVRDSKKLSDKRIKALAPQVRKLLRARSRATVIQPARFNTLYTEMNGEGKNLNSLLAWGHTRSVLDLLRAGAAPAYLIVDQFADTRYIEERLLEQADAHSMEILQFPKAEADSAVAAASILAREAFLHWIDRTSEAVGMELPKGAGTQAVEAAARLVHEHGSERLGDLTKISFRTTAKVLELVADQAS
jgi:ribonuclease HIII